MGCHTGLAHKISFVSGFIDPAVQSHGYLASNSKMVLGARWCDRYWCIDFGKMAHVSIVVALNIAILLILNGFI